MVVERLVWNLWQRDATGIAIMHKSVAILLGRLVPRFHLRNRNTEHLLP